MDKGLIMWIVFAAVFVVGLLVSRMIKDGTEKNGIEADAIISRIVDDGTPTEIDINVYVHPRSDLEEGQRVRIKYHPKMKGNARLV